MFVSGFMFNRIYRGHVMSRIKKIKSKNLSGEQLLNELTAKGGVNFAVIVVLLVAYFSIYYMLILLLTQSFGA